MTLEDLAGGAARGPFPTGVSSGDNLQQLLGSPAGMPPAGLEQDLGDLGRSLMRITVRTPRHVVKPRRSFGLIPLDPLVSGLPADPVPVAELRDGEQVALVVGDESYLLVHGRRLAPRHWDTSSRCPSLPKLSPMY